MQDNLLVNVWGKLVESRLYNQIDGQFAPHLRSYWSKALASRFSPSKKSSRVSSGLGARCGSGHSIEMCGPATADLSLPCPFSEGALGNCERVRNKEHMVCGKERVEEKEKGKKKRRGREKILKFEKLTEQGRN